MDTLEARIARIESQLNRAERSARTWRLLAVAATGVVCTGGLLAAVQDQPQDQPNVADAKIVDVIKARRFELVGADDKTMALLLTDDKGGRLDMWNAAGGNIVRIAGNDHGGDVAVWNSAGSPVGGVFATDLGGRIEIGDASGNTLASVARGEEGGALVLAGPAGAGGEKSGSSLRAEAGAVGAVMSMRRSDGSVGWLAGVAQGTSILSMRNQSDKEIFFAGAASDQSSVLRMADAAGNETAVFTSAAGGSLQLKDGAGAAVANVASAGAGKGGVFEVLNAGGHAAVSADCGGDGGGRLAVHTSGGSPAFAAEASGTGGTASTFKDDRRMAALGASDLGGLLNLLDNAGQPVVIAGMASDGDGGAVSMRNLRGVTIARIGVDKIGSGEMAIYNSAGTYKKVVTPPVPPKE